MNNVVAPLYRFLLTITRIDWLLTWRISFPVVFYRGESPWLIVGLRNLIFYLWDLFSLTISIFVVLIRLVSLFCSNWIFFNRISKFPRIIWSVHTRKRLSDRTWTQKLFRPIYLLRPSKVTRACLDLNRLLFLFVDDSIGKLWLNHRKCL